MHINMSHVHVCTQRAKLRAESKRLKMDLISSQSKNTTSSAGSSEAVDSGQL